MTINILVGDEPRRFNPKIKTIELSASKVRNKMAEYMKELNVIPVFDKGRNEVMFPMVDLVNFVKDFMESI